MRELGLLLRLFGNFAMITVVRWSHSSSLVISISQRALLYDLPRHCRQSDEVKSKGVASRLQLSVLTVGKLKERHWRIPGLRER